MVFEKVEKFRILYGAMRSSTGDDFGAFVVRGPHHRNLIIIASSGTDEIPWEHVSVSTMRKYCPTWLEMCFVKGLFWPEETTVMQLHPPRSEWINNHPNCLHLWRPKDQEIPMPPGVAVGFKELNRA